MRNTLHTYLHSELTKKRSKSVVRFVASVTWLLVLGWTVLAVSYFRRILHNFAYLEFFPRELWLPLGLYAGEAIIIVFIISALGRRWRFGQRAIAVVVMAMLLVDFGNNLHSVAGLVRSFTPNMTASDPLHYVAIVYIFLLFVIAIRVGKLVIQGVGRFPRIKDLDVLLAVSMLVLYFAWGPVLQLKGVWDSISRQTGVAIKPFAPAPQVDRPDIYYIVLDRYASSQTLQNQFNFSNAPFLQFLNEQGFTVNNNALSHYPYTTMSIASTLVADYTNQYVEPYVDESVQSRALYHSLIWRSPVIAALKDVGYKYYSLGSWYGATYRAPLADRDYNQEPYIGWGTKIRRVRGLEAIELKESPFALLMQSTTKPDSLRFVDNDHIGDVRQQLNSLDGISQFDEPGGRFVFAHILVPHDPYYFNADGSISDQPGTDSIGKPIKQKYIGQVEFINEHIRNLIRQIKNQSNSKAVIILNADEGPWPQYLNDTLKTPQVPDEKTADSIVTTEDMRQWPQDWLQMKFGILQAAYIPKATQEDLAQLSSVNLFRIILNRYAGTQLTYLPSCHFGTVQGTAKEFQYADITAMVAPDNADCSQFATIK